MNIFMGVLLSSSLAVVVQSRTVQLGPRPFWITDQMRDTPLKSQLGKLDFGVIWE